MVPAGLPKLGTVHRPHRRGNPLRPL